MAQHFKKVCSCCEKIVTECRCPYVDKITINVICEDCQKKIDQNDNPLEKVTDQTAKLNNLLTNSEPGLFSWNEAVKSSMKDLRDEIDFLLNMNKAISKSRDRSTNLESSLCDNLVSTM